MFITYCRPKPEAETRERWHCARVCERLGAGLARQCDAPTQRDCAAALPVCCYAMNAGMCIEFSLQDDIFGRPAALPALLTHSLMMGAVANC